MAPTEFKLIINAAKILDLAMEAQKLKKKGESFSSLPANFVMLDDARRENAKIYKLEKPIKPKGKTPSFLFL